MADHFDAQRTLGAGPRRREDRAHRGDGDEDEDQRRREGPPDLEHRVPVHRFREAAADAGAIAHDDDEQQRFDDEKHDDRPPKNGGEQAIERGAEIGFRGEDRLRILEPEHASN